MGRCLRDAGFPSRIFQDCGIAGRAGPTPSGVSRASERHRPPESEGYARLGGRRLCYGWGPPRQLDPNSILDVRLRGREDFLVVSLPVVDGGYPRSGATWVFGQDRGPSAVRITGSTFPDLLFRCHRPDSRFGLSYRTILESGILRLGSVSVSLPDWRKRWIPPPPKAATPSRRPRVPRRPSQRIQVLDTLQGVMNAFRADPGPGRAVPF